MEESSVDQAVDKTIPVESPRRKKHVRPGSLGNRRAIRHGLTTGSLPKGCGYIIRICNEMRRQVEDAVVDARGEINLSEAAIIQTLCRWERHALLAQRWLTKGKLDADQILNFSREVARASAERDRCMKALNIDRKAGDLLDAIYSVPAGEGVENSGVEPKTHGGAQ